MCISSRTRTKFYVKDLVDVLYKWNYKTIKKVTFRVIGIVWKLQWPMIGQTSWPIVLLCFKPVEHVCRSKHTILFFPCYFTFFQPNLLCSTLIAVESTNKKKELGKCATIHFSWNIFKSIKLEVCQSAHRHMILPFTWNCQTERVFMCSELIGSWFCNHSWNVDTVTFSLTSTAKSIPARAQWQKMLKKQAALHFNWVV